MKTSLAIQAGGQSSRMGTDKALILFKGQPLIERIIQRLKPIADEILITSNQPEDLLFLGYPVYPDLYPGLGALGGLYTALYYSQNPVVLIVATDMPFPSLALYQKQIEFLVAQAMDVVIPVSHEGFEPFHAVYRREACLPTVKQALETGQKRMISWFPDGKVRVLSVEEVKTYDKRVRAFININTFEELTQAEMLDDEEST